MIEKRGEERGKRSVSGGKSLFFIAATDALFRLSLLSLSLFLFLPLPLSPSLFCLSPLSISLTCRWRRHVHGGLNPGRHAPALRRGAGPLPVVDVTREDEVNGIFEKDGLERAREVGCLFKLPGLGKVGVERAGGGWFWLFFMIIVSQSR